MNQVTEIHGIQEALVVLKLDRTAYASVMERQMFNGIIDC
jgi:hypothetical protein